MAVTNKFEFIIIVNFGQKKNIGCPNKDNMIQDQTSLILDDDDEAALIVHFIQSSRVYDVNYIRNNDDHPDYRISDHFLGFPSHTHTHTPKNKLHQKKNKEKKL